MCHVSCVMCNFLKVMDVAAGWNHVKLADVHEAAVTYKMPKDTAMR